MVSFLFLFLLNGVLTYLPPIALASPLFPSFLPSSLPLPHPPTSINISTTQNSPHCNRLPAWVRAEDAYRPEDCVRAVNAFRMDMRRAHDVAYQWLAMGAVALPDGGQPVYLPRRYPWGTCTLTLASLLDVGPIPDKPATARTKGNERVLAKWTEIGRNVASLGSTCVLEAGAVGWMPYGDNIPQFSIRSTPLGIFFWATGSEIDKSAPDPGKFKMEEEAEIDFL